jgi:farnesyl-diphosphate farnesyltransferase
VNTRDIDRLRGPILRSVSRSFYLSLRILPRPLRDPLSLAYLLARATDTIADTPEPPAELRIEALQNLAWVIQGTASRETAASIGASFGPLQSNEAERALIDALPAALGWLELLEERDRCEVREVLEKINRGQMLDLERFGVGSGTSTSTSTRTSTSTSTSIKALRTAGELDEYTYLVAGCVGEFWTRVCFAHVENFCDRHEPAMLALGVQYGKGLQLINILRDAGSDLREGRCYLPAEELDLLGLAPNQVLADHGRAEPVMQHWREKAGRDLAAGLEYACAIRSWRVRLATALPALIGARTLSILRAAGSEVFGHKVKVTRAEVREILLSITLKLASPHSLRKTFHRLSS